MGTINSTSYNSLNIFDWNLADYRNRVRLYDTREDSPLPISIEAYRIAHHGKKPTITKDAIFFTDGTKIPVDE